MLLITPNEVVSLAFMGREMIDPLAIRALKIDIASEQYIRPRMGDTLYNELKNGEYDEFVSEYIKPALAYYVRASIIDELSIRISDNGAIVYDNMTKGNRSQLNRKNSNTGELRSVDTETQTTSTEEKDYTNTKTVESTVDKTGTETSQEPVDTTKITESEYSEEAESTQSDTFAQSVESHNNQTSTVDENSSINLSQSGGAEDTYSSEMMRAATSQQRKVLVLRALDDAKVLIAKAVRYVEKHSDDFPSYEPMNLSQRIFF